MVRESEAVNFMDHLSKSTLSDFLTRRPFSVVHVDAAWDGYRSAVAIKIRGIELRFEPRVSFGYVDCDLEQDYCAEIRIVNVPSVVYYSGTRLFGLVIGVRQDIAENIERMTRGEPLDQSNVLSRR